MEFTMPKVESEWRRRQGDLLPPEEKHVPEKHYIQLNFELAAAVNI
jgi:hypothetical protein